MAGMSRKVLWGVVGVVIVLILGGLYFLWHRTSVKNTCNDVLYEPLKKHLQKDAYNQLKYGFYNVWVTKHYFMNTACSYFTMKSDGSSMLGFQNKSESSQDTYGKFVQRSSGVIDIYTEKDGNTTIGRIYPVFSQDFVVGNVFCDENEGHPQWRSVVSVQEPMIKNEKTPSLVSSATKLFQDLEAEVGLGLGLGQDYVQPCYVQPQWRDETKN